MTDEMTIQETFDSATRHHQAGQLDLAEKLYMHVLRADPHNADVLHSLGIIAHQRGKQKTAVDLLGRAIKHNPRNPYFHNNIGLILAACGRNDEAIKAFRIAVSMKSDYADAHYNLGCALKNQGLSDEAGRCFTKALHLKPDFVEAWYNLGNAQQAKSQFDAAIESYNHALRLQPSFEKAYNNMGLALKAQGDVRSAIGKYKKAIALNPGFAEAQWNLSLAELLCGNFIEGFKGYEWRFKKSDWKSTYPFRYDIPCWDGSSFPGKKLFVHSEQGLGDTMQFVRYLPMVKAAGGTVIFETAQSLAGLFQNFAGIDKIVEPSSDGRMREECDMYIPLLSLPRIFRTTLETIPADIPYLYADNDKAEYWKGKLAHNDFKVGLVWAGKSTHHNDSNRSCALKHFIILASIHGVRLYGLQKGEAATQVMRLPHGIEIKNIGEELEDFRDTAGVIENLDLVISVDTAVAHLAGAMGKTVWALLPFAPDWRWLLEREDSPWYPTMRLFRQQSRNDWDAVLQNVATELHLLSQGSTSR